MKRASWDCMRVHAFTIPTWRLLVLVPPSLDQSLAGTTYSRPPHCTSYSVLRPPVCSTAAYGVASLDLHKSRSTRYSVQVRPYYGGNGLDTEYQYSVQFTKIRFENLLQDPTHSSIPLLASAATKQSSLHLERQHCGMKEHRNALNKPSRQATRLLSSCWPG
jgi:hypothetical protein